MNRGLRKCHKCNRYKPSTQFQKDLSKRDGLRYDCRQCRSKTSKAYYRNPKRRAKVLKYTKAHKDRHRIVQLKYMYGISIEDYNKLHVEQNGLCAICNRAESRKNSKYLCVDHCHRTGKIRGLLCHQCNSAIGKLDDDIELLQKAVTYLKRYEDA